MIITTNNEITVLNNKNSRITRQRMVILDELRKLTSHPTADELYEVVRRVLPHISLGTVYRNLEILSEQGHIKKLVFNNNQKRFDGNTVRHYHVRCISCNRIIDIPPNIQVEVKYSQDISEDFKIIDYCLHFLGFCEECILKKNTVH